ncbi:hypothetical protein ACSBOB_01450 [Mesorhizobium sp. ASY16-5R]|uniref:hypothetical protein n=1 Tax=Mesorhizobium sp. ASY16-5R TaxID=3445772 RepID=UPI003FA13862
MAEALLPQTKMPKLVVVAAFDPDGAGDLQAVFGPAEQQSEERAVRIAKTLALKHEGVIAWSREASPALGEYGSPTVLFQHGNVPDME